MSEKLVRAYPYIAHALILIWFLWWLFPLSAELDPYGGLRLTGFIAIDLLFLSFGILGYVLCLLTEFSYDLATSLCAVPLFHAIALVAGDSDDIYLPVIYICFFLSIPFFTFIWWRRS